MCHTTIITLLGSVCHTTIITLLGSVCHTTIITLLGSVCHTTIVTILGSVCHTTIITLLGSVCHTTIITLLGSVCHTTIITLLGSVCHTTIITLLGSVCHTTIITLLGSVCHTTILNPDIAHTYCTVHYIMNSISHCQCMHRGQEITNSFVKANVNLPSPPAQIFTITSHPVLLCRTPHLLSSTAPSAPLSGPPCPFHLSPPATLPSSPQTPSVPSQI